MHEAKAKGLTWPNTTVVPIGTRRLNSATSHYFILPMCQTFISLRKLYGAKQQRNTFYGHKSNNLDTSN